MCIRNVPASVLTARDKTLTKRLSKENAAAKTLVFLQKSTLRARQTETAIRNYFGQSWIISREFLQDSRLGWGAAGRMLLPPSCLIVHLRLWAPHPLPCFGFLLESNHKLLFTTATKSSRKSLMEMKNIHGREGASFWIITFKTALCAVCTNQLQPVLSGGIRRNQERWFLNQGMFM